MADENRRGYRLVLVDYVNNKEEPFVLLERNFLEDIDAFTSNFIDFETMIESLNENASNKLNIISAYIERIGGSHKRYEILYKKDIFDVEKVVRKYTEYVLAHPQYFNKSPARFVNVKYVDQCLRVYFRDRNYRDVRGAYFELKELGEAGRVLDTSVSFEEFQDKKNPFDSDNFEYYSDDIFLNSLLNKENGPDWDNIYKYYSNEQLSMLLKKEFKSNKRAR